MNSSEVDIRIKTLPHFDGLELPRYMSEGASALDLTAAISGEVVIKPGERVLIPTGIAIAMPHGIEAQIRPRSGLALKHGITMLNSPGTIDSDYRGEIQVIAINLGQEAFTVTRGLRIAQMVISQVVKAKLTLADNLDSTSRGQSGFGHTGTH